MKSSEVGVMREVFENENEYEYVAPRAEFSPRRHVLVLVLVLVLASRLHAQEVPELVTDRPDQTESAEVVPSGWLQIEAGGVMEQDGDGPDGAPGARVWTLPGVLLRWGVSERFELRLATAWVLEEREEADAVVPPGKSITERGTEPLSIGMKYQFLAGGIPSIAAILMLALPSTVAGDFPANNPAGELRLTVAQDFSDVFSLGCNLAVEQDLEEARSGLHYTLVAGFGLGERSGAYVELFGSRDTGEDSFRHRMDGGFTFLITPDLQWDLSAGVELDPRDGAGRRKDAGYFAGSGISWRFPITE